MVLGTYEQTSQYKSENRTDVTYYNSVSWMTPCSLALHVFEARDKTCVAAVERALLPVADAEQPTGNSGQHTVESKPPGEVWRS